MEPERSKEGARTPIQWFQERKPLVAFGICVVVVLILNLIRWLSGRPSAFEGTG